MALDDEDDLPDVFEEEDETSSVDPSTVTMYSKSSLVSEQVRPTASTPRSPARDVTLSEQVRPTASTPRPPATDISVTDSGIGHESSLARSLSSAIIPLIIVSASRTTSEEPKSGSDPMRGNSAAVGPGLGAATEDEDSDDGIDVISEEDSHDMDTTPAPVIPPKTKSIPTTPSIPTSPKTPSTATTSFSVLATANTSIPAATILAAASSSTPTTGSRPDLNNKPSLSAIPVVISKAPSTAAAQPSSSTREEEGGGGEEEEDSDNEYLVIDESARAITLPSAPTPSLALVEGELSLNVASVVKMIQLHVTPTRSLSKSVGEMREKLTETTRHEDMVPGSLLHFAGQVKPQTGPYYIGFLAHLDAIERRLGLLSSSRRKEMEDSLDKLFLSVEPLQLVLFHSLSVHQMFFRLLQPQTHLRFCKTLGRHGHPKEEVLRLLSGAYSHLTLSVLLHLRATAHHPRNTVAVSLIDVALNERFLASTPFDKVKLVDRFLNHLQEDLETDRNWPASSLPLRVLVSLVRSSGGKGVFEFVREELQAEEREVLEGFSYHSESAVRCVKCQEFVTTASAPAHRCPSAPQPSGSSGSRSNEVSSSQDCRHDAAMQVNMDDERWNYSINDSILRVAPQPAMERLMPTLHAYESLDDINSHHLADNQHHLDQLELDQKRRHALKNDFEVRAELIKSRRKALLAYFPFSVL